MPRPGVDSIQQGKYFMKHASVRTAIRLALGLSAATGLVSTALAADDLAEVVVTAQFREQNLQDTPLAITAVSGALLESRNQTNITEITNQAPNVTLKQQGANFGPAMAASIRGVGQSDFNPAVEPGVGIYVDDVYYATLTGSVLDLLDLDRVEILRGPQGTLAGKNSIGGAVKLYSKTPKGDDAGSLAVTYGSRHRTDLRASADFAIADNLFARVSGVSKKQDGYIDRIDYGCAFPNNPYGIQATRATTAGCVIDRDSNVDFSAARAQLRFIASDDLEFNLSADWTSDHRNPTGMVLLDYKPQSAAILANIQPFYDADPLNDVSGTPFVTGKGSYRTYATFSNAAGLYNGTTTVSGAYNPIYNTTPASKLVNYPLLAQSAIPRQFFDGGGASLNIDWKINESMKLKSVTAYREYNSGFTNDNDTSPMSTQLGDGNLPFHSFAEELRLNGTAAAGKVDYTVGGFYQDQRSRYMSAQDLRYTGNYPLQFQQNDVTNANTKAVFGHLGYNATDRLSLTTGVRYTKEHKDYNFVRLSRDGTVHPFLGALNGVRSDYNGSNVDYRAAAQYRWNDELMTYAQVSTGFKGGGISPRPFVPGQARPFNPEKLRSFEVGGKSDLFDRKLRLNGALFYSKYKDLQLGLSTCPQYNNNIPGPCGVIANAGDATIKGAELEIVYRPVAGLSVDASYSYIDFGYDRLPAGSPYKLNYVAPFMPKQKYSAGVQYEVVMGEHGTVTPRVDVSYQGGIYTNGNNLPTAYIDAYSLVNARITWRQAGGKWESALELTNLTDKWYMVSRGDAYNTPGAGTTDAQPGRPREFAITVKRKF